MAKMKMKKVTMKKMSIGGMANPNKPVTVSPKKGKK